MLIGVLLHALRKLEAPPGFEPGVEVLQTSALPLGDGAPKKQHAGPAARATTRRGQHAREVHLRADATADNLRWLANRSSRLCWQRERRLERETGFEPATSTLARSHSTTELFPPERPNYHTAGLAFKRRARLKRSPLGTSRDLCRACQARTMRYNFTARSTCAASSGDVGLM